MQLNMTIIRNESIADENDLQLGFAADLRATGAVGRSCWPAGEGNGLDFSVCFLAVGYGSGLGGMRMTRWQD
ncbi:MAG: hypothetical protein RIC93_06680, partial [Alphaproteobacteria bacterium]